MHDAGEQPKQASKRQALRRLQQRTALQSMNGPSAAPAGPLHSGHEPSATCSGSSDGIIGQPEPSPGLHSMPLGPVGKQLGFPGRPSFEGGATSETVSSSLLQPGRQGSLLHARTEYTFISSLFSSP